MPLTVITLENLQRVYSHIKTLISGKQNTITGAASTVTDTDLLAGSVLVTDNDGKITASTAASATDVGYLHGVRSSIQGQLDSIGTMLSILPSESVTAPSGQTMQLATLTIPKGNWLLIGCAEFCDNNVAGTRLLRFSLDSTGATGGGLSRFSIVKQYEPATDDANIQVTMPYRVLDSAGVTMYLFAKQNTGANQVIDGIGIRAVRLQ